MAYKAETYHLNLINSHFIDYLSVFAMKQKKKHSFILRNLMKGRKEEREVTQFEGRQL